MPIKHMIDRNRVLCNNELVSDIPQATWVGGGEPAPETVQGCDACRDIAEGLERLREIPEGDDLESKVYIDGTHDIVLASRVSLTEGNIEFLNRWLYTPTSGGMGAVDRPLYLVQTPWRIKHAREGDFIVQYREGVFDVWRPHRFLSRYTAL